MKEGKQESRKKGPGTPPLKSLFTKASVRLDSQTVLEVEEEKLAR